MRVIKHTTSFNFSALFNGIAHGNSRRGKGFSRVQSDGEPSKAGCSDGPVMLKDRSTEIGHLHECPRHSDHTFQDVT
jgi:hypothetical protein